MSVLFDCYQVDCFFGVLSFSELVKRNKIKEMVQRVDWSPRKRCKIVLLSEQGYSYEEIRRQIGGNITKGGISKFLKKYKETQSLQNQTGKGRKRCTTASDDRIIKRLCLCDRRKSSGRMQDEMAQCNVKLSARTVRHRLQEFDLNARIPRKKPFLSLRQRVKRLNCAKTHVNWTMEQWDSVIWSDETRISLFGSDGIKYVRRRIGEDLHPDCITRTVKHPVSVMIWGCMTSKGVGRICVINGNINAQKYINVILEPKLMPSAHDLFQDNEAFIFQQESAPCHVAAVCKKWFQDNHIPLLEWPGNNPDLNPMENLWSRLKRLVRQKQPSNKTQLIEAIIQSWFHIITAAELKNLVHSMGRRCEAVIKAKGYPTKY